MEVIAIGLVWLVCGIIAAAAADGKRLNGCLGAIAGFILGPFGVALVLLWPARPPTAGQRGEVEHGDERVCPHCRSMIPAAATVCRFCQRAVPEVMATEPRPAASLAAPPLSASVPEDLRKSGRGTRIVILVGTAILLLIIASVVRKGTTPHEGPHKQAAVVSRPNEQKQVFDLVVKRINQLDDDMISNYRVSGKHLVVVVNADRWNLISAQDQALTLKTLADSMQLAYQQHHTDAEARTVTVFVQDLAGTPIAQRGVESP